MATVICLTIVGVAGGRAYMRPKWEARAAAEEEQLRQQEQEWARGENQGSWPDAKRVLDAHAKALLDGDEQGWLAAIDPDNKALRDRYRKLFTTYRQLGVTAWTYFVEKEPNSEYGVDSLRFDTTVIYCLGTVSCPKYPGGGYELPEIPQRLAMLRPSGRDYVITEVKNLPSTWARQGLPWEKTSLVYAHGKHVVVAAPATLKARLAPAVAAADRAAEEIERFRKYSVTPQRQYRVFLAGAKEWKIWYGGHPSRYARGYAASFGRVGTDVVLKMNGLSDNELHTVIRHEFGHALTLGGVMRLSNADSWLEEGIANYIEYWPKAPSQTDSRWGLPSGGKVPKSLVRPPLDADVSDRTANIFYSVSHYGVGCMARRYGERKLFVFVQQVLHKGRPVEGASQTAFGVSWKTVDRACIAEIKQAVG